MKFAKSCRVYSNSHHWCWASLKFVNDKTFNSVVMILFSFKVTLILTPNFYFQIFDQIGNNTMKNYISIKKFRLAC